MFKQTDYDKLQQIMNESPEKKELLTRLLESHRMDVSAISHEIRNPLTIVYSTLQLIESQHPEVKTFKHWESMHQDIEYMKELLEQLSAYNNGECLSITPIDTNTFFKTAALSFATSIIDTDIEFTSKIEPELPMINGDTIKLRQLILNLLTNARDAVTDRSFTEARNDSHFQPHISLEIHKHQSKLIVSVTDNGCGITSEQIETIFEPFITHKKNGTGLGLAISSRVAKAHHGTLTAASTPRVSTVFTLTLPI